MLTEEKLREQAISTLIEKLDVDKEWFDEVTKAWPGGPLGLCLELQMELDRLQQQEKPNLNDTCTCGHARFRHEYGALGYNAASDCKTCDCPAFEIPAPPVTKEGR